MTTAELPGQPELQLRSEPRIGLRVARRPVTVTHTSSSILQTMPSRVRHAEAANTIIHACVARAERYSGVPPVPVPESHDQIPRSSKVTERGVCPRQPRHRIRMTL